MAKTASNGTNGLTEAVLYTRVSSDDQAREGVSLDAQLGECRRYAAHRGWALGAEYLDVMSGKRDDRPAYRAMLADVRTLGASGRHVAVVVAALDRFGRRLAERLRCREELKALGVPVHSSREGGEVSDLVANILGAVAEEESRRIGERVTASLQHIQANGWHVGHTPWGYRSREATPEERAVGAPLRVLDLDPDTAPYVRELFGRVADGSSIHRAAKWAASLPEAARGGRRLAVATVQQALQGLAYIPNDARRWPEVVDPDTWRRAQEQIAQHRRIPAQASGRFLLTGFLRCPRCGERMVGRQSKGQAPRYVCIGGVAGADSPGPTCTATAQGPTLEAAFLADVARVLEVATATALRPALRKAWAALQTPEDSVTGKRIARLEADLARGKKRLADAALLLVDGKIDRDGYTLAKERVEADLAGTEAELARMRTATHPVMALPPLEDVFAEASTWREVLAGSDTGTTRDVLAKLVTRVVPVRVRHGQYRAAITWTPLGEALDGVAMTLA